MVLLVIATNRFFRPQLIIRMPFGNLSSTSLRLHLQVPTRNVNGLYKISNVALIIA